jgi:pyridoxamine 5'-phosphate oxidase
VPIPARALRESDVDSDPFVQFARWYDDAVEHGELQPDAMIVASSTPDAVPSVRMVLLRGVDERGFCFFTNYDSRKGRELDANPRAAIAFHWPEVLRQVRATGTVERVDDTESDAYWNNRPRASRVSAWASEQSEVAVSREELEARAAEFEARFAGGDVARPPGWGGYRVIPDDVEFWQHRDDRLHDRLRYARRAGDDAWRIERLQP